VASDFRQDMLDGKWGIKFQREQAYQNLQFNDAIIDLTKKIAAEKTSTPKFIYTHLMLPHSPYYFDSKGHPSPLSKFTGKNRWNEKDYIEYLQYSNGKILELVDHILSFSYSPPIIIILSDHGFRREQENVNPLHEFINLNAVYFPDKNYQLLYDSITNCNEFRVVFNSYFNQHLPLLKDSTVNLRGE